MKTNKKIKHEICKILDISDKTYYNWKQDKRPIIIFLEKYFDKEELEEFSKTGKMTKLEYFLKVSALSSDDFIMLSNVLQKIEIFIKNTHIHREKFLIKLYRTLRDMPEEPTLNIDTYLKNYDMVTFESLQNIMLGATLDDIITFYNDYLSQHEINILRQRKLHILPILKSMRNYNAHLKD